MSAAGCILKAAVLDLGGVVGMAGPGAVLEIFIVPGAGVVIADHCGNGGAAGEAVQKAREKFRGIGLPPGVDQLLWPGARRFKKACNFSWSTERPAGMPSRVMPMAAPWDWPKMDNFKFSP